jgi:DNA-binding NarL/FixJ family response regulator
LGELPRRDERDPYSCVTRTGSRMGVGKEHKDRLASSLPQISACSEILRRRAALKVFVADSSAILRKQIICLLSELRGVEIVGQAQAAPEALRAIREHKPDVVTLDIQMSDGGGIDVLRKIKRDGSATVVIVLTNSTSPPYRKSSMEAGADFFLDKSTEFKEVREIIQSLLERFDSTGAGAARDCAGSDI